MTQHIVDVTNIAAGSRAVLAQDGADDIDDLADFITGHPPGENSGEYLVDPTTIAAGSKALLAQAGADDLMDLAEWVETFPVHEEPPPPPPPPPPPAGSTDIVTHPGTNLSVFLARDNAYPGTGKGRMSYSCPTPCESLPAFGGVPGLVMDHTGGHTDSGHNGIDVALWDDNAGVFLPWQEWIPASTISDVQAPFDDNWLHQDGRFRSVHNYYSSHYLPAGVLGPNPVIMTHKGAPYPVDGGRTATVHTSVLDLLTGAQTGLQFSPNPSKHSTALHHPDGRVFLVRNGMWEYAGNGTDLVIQRQRSKAWGYPYARPAVLHPTSDRIIQIYSSASGKSRVWDVSPGGSLTWQDSYLTGWTAAQVSKMAPWYDPNLDRICWYSGHVNCVASLDLDALRIDYHPLGNTFTPAETPFTGHYRRFGYLPGAGYYWMPGYGLDLQTVESIGDPVVGSPP